MTGPAGVVTAARKEAAAAGASTLRRGGNAVDAAIATAFALCVTDPANCGLGGYGGFALLDGASISAQVNFNTHVPRGFAHASVSQAPRRGPFLYGGPSIAPPATVAGLEVLHRRFGRSDWADVVAPAILLADGGFDVGFDLARAAAWAISGNRAIGFGLQGLLHRDGRVISASDRLFQPDLAETLREIAARGAEAFREGALAERIAKTVGAHGGSFGRDELRHVAPKPNHTESLSFAGATILGCDPDESGFSIVATCLEGGSVEDWPRQRNGSYAHRLVVELGRAWREREDRVRSLTGAPASEAQHTTHLCASDDAGLLVSMTLTQGPLWFGSGILAEGTGVILNCGANLYVEDRQNGRRFAQTNMTPIILRRGSGSRTAFGTPGGRKIPAMAVAFAVDLLARNDDVATAIGHPRVSVAQDGRCEAEMPFAALLDDCRTINVEEFYGPASAIEVGTDGVCRGTTDPRFQGAVAEA